MNTPDDKDEVLYAFAIEPNHDKATLERYLADYPAFAEEIIDLSAELRLSAASGPTTAESIPDPGLDTAWSKFLASSPPRPQPDAADIFARFQGVAFGKLAKAMNVPRTILAAVQEGLVVPDSIPSGFLHRLGEAMATPLSVIRDHLAHPQNLPVALAFKSDAKPVQQEQTSFRKLVLNTEMTEEQRRILLHECDADELP